jgi:hypothetical protein
MNFQTDIQDLLKQAQLLSSNREKQLDEILKQNANLLDEKTVLFIKNTITSAKNGTITLADMPSVTEQLNNIAKNIINDANRNTSK